MSGFIGIDPGNSGAIAFWKPEISLLKVWDMPTHTLKINGSKRRVLDEYEVGRILRSISEASVATVEEVHSMPKQGVASTFTFGFASGGVRCATASLEIRMELVTPNTWKRALRVSADKDSSRRRASQIFPKHCGLWPNVGHHGRAEAALLAYFGSKFFKPVEEGVLA
jgi:crossover junction endodeoxyribonuclease RuvC